MSDPKRPPISTVRYVVSILLFGVGGLFLILGIIGLIQTALGEKNEMLLFAIICAFSGAGMILGALYLRHRAPADVDLFRSVISGAESSGESQEVVEEPPERSGLWLLYFVLVVPLFLLALFVWDDLLNAIKGEDLFEGIAALITMALLLLLPLIRLIWKSKKEKNRTDDSAH